MKELLTSWVELDIPGPGVFVNVFNHGMDTGTYLITADPFPAEMNYVVLGLGSAAADFAVKLHTQGWPAVIAVDPSSSAPHSGLLEGLHEGSGNGSHAMLFLSGISSSSLSPSEEALLPSSARSGGGETLRTTERTEPSKSYELEWRQISYCLSDVK